jgi:hypothetical protein
MEDSLETRRDDFIKEGNWHGLRRDENKGTVLLVVLFA